MKKLLKFLTDLEAHKIHYYLEHNRDDSIMVHIAIPGERWEVEFFIDNHVEIEIFKNSEGVYTDESLLSEIYTIHEGSEFEVKIQLQSTADSNKFIEDFVSEAIEANGLAVGGNPIGEGCFISMYDRGAVTEKLRNLVEAWISSHPDVLSYSVGELQNAKA